MSFFVLEPRFWTRSSGLRPRGRDLLRTGPKSSGEILNRILGHKISRLSEIDRPHFAYSW